MPNKHWNELSNMFNLSRDIQNVCAPCKLVWQCLSDILVNIMERKQLQFVAFNSFLDSGFWHKLSENKLDVYGLDESQKEIKGFYFNGNTLIILYSANALLFGTA